MEKKKRGEDGNGGEKTWNILSIEWLDGEKRWHWICLLDTPLSFIMRFKAR
ncbi:hypothetical protein FH972_027322 [Carpinus fangiana]|uniref:Uncharacterized protein n=1 Tax=Carpinus fangiana TaxID=176857 RepID=A0A5N6PWT9_9ROSI|nr:hypothetical protein FH972_027322 [Carpinus fangiana]